MPPKAKGRAKSGAVATRSATAAKGKNAVYTVTSAGKGKRSSMETKDKRKSSKGKEASSESSDEQGQDNSSEDESSSTPTTTTNVLDIEDVKRDAFNMDWSAALADDMAKRLKQPKRVWDEASTWAELTSGNDSEYASRLRYSYLNAVSKLQAPKPESKLPKTKSEAKALLKAVKSDNQIRVCKDSLNGLMLLGHIRGITQDFKTHGLEYVIACAYARRMREAGSLPLSEFAGIDVLASLELQFTRKANSPELQALDEKIAAARVLATFGDKDSCPIMLNKFNDVRGDPQKCLDVLLQLSSNAFQPDDHSIDTLLFQATKEIKQMFEIKPKWSVLAMFEKLKITFQVLENVPKRYWEDELMCNVNAVIKDAPSNYASRKDNGLVNDFCRKIREDFNLNIGKPGYGRIRGEQGNIWTPPCDSASFLQALATMVQADASRKAGVESYDAEGSQAKALTQGAGGKRNFGAAFGQAGHGGGRSNAGGNGNSGGSGNAGGAHASKECYACGRLGHIRDNCHAKKHKNGGPIREHSGKNKTQKNNGGNNQGASSGQPTRVISAVDARRKFENHAKRNHVADEDLDRAADSFQVVASDICEENAKLAGEVAKLRATVAQLSKGNGKANGGKGGKKAKSGKQGKGASKKKRKKQQVKAVSMSDDAVAQVDGHGGAASSEDIRRVSDTYSRLFGVQAIVALCFFGLFLCGEAFPVGTVGMGATTLRPNFFHADNFRSKAWQGRVHMRVPTPYEGRKVQRLVLGAEDEWVASPRRLAAWQAAFNQPLGTVRQRVISFVSSNLVWVGYPFNYARAAVFSGIRTILEALVRFRGTLRTKSCLFYDDPVVWEAALSRARMQFQRRCARTYLTSVRANVDGLCVRVNSAAAFESDWDEVGEDVSVLNISTAATQHFPWWDMRKPCWRGELTDEFSEDRVKVHRRRRKSKRDASVRERGEVGSLIWLGVMVVLTAAWFANGSVVSLANLLRERELVESAAALFACVFSTAMPTIVKVLYETVFSLATCFVWTATSVFVIAPMRGLACFLKMGVWLIDFCLGTLPSVGQRRRSRNTFRRLRARWMAEAGLNSRPTLSGRELDIAQRLLNNRTIVERKLGGDKAAAGLPSMESVFESWFGNVSALFALDVKEDDAPASTVPGGKAQEPEQPQPGSREAKVLQGLAADEPLLQQCLDEYEREERVSQRRETRKFIRNLVSADGRDYVFEAVAGLPRFAIRGAQAAIRSLDVLVDSFDDMRVAAVRATQPVKKTLAKISILVDSGANISAITLKGLLWKMRKMPGNVATAQQGPPIQVVNGGTLRTEHFDVENVRYIPQLSSFILAVGDVTAMGWSVHFYQTYAYLERESDKKRVYLVRRNRCWYLETTVEVSNPENYTSTLDAVRAVARCAFEPFSNCFVRNLSDDDGSDSSGNDDDARQGSARDATDGGGDQGASSSSEDDGQPGASSGSEDGVQQGASSGAGGSGQRNAPTPSKRARKRKSKHGNATRARLPLPPTAKQLHERFHVQFSLLKRLAGKAYYGQDNKGNKVVMPNDWAQHAGAPCACDVCFRAKSRVKRGKRSHTVYEQPGSMVAVDTFSIGKTGITSIGGHRYATIFIDLATRYIKIYLHKQRKDRLRMFVHYLAWCASYDIKVRAFRVDPAREWLVDPLRKYFDAKGVRLEVIPPRQQDANGVAERCVQLLKQTARALMLDSNAPHSLWALAVQYAVHINNALPRVPARNVNGRMVFSRDNPEQYASAHELYFNSLPDITHFKRFGSLAYPHVDKQELLQRKQHAWLSARADRGVFVGVHDGERAQLVLLPSRNYILAHTSSCRNDESRMYFSASSASDSPPAAATTTRGKRARSAFEGVFVPAVSQPLDNGAEDEVELEDCLSGTEDMGEDLDRWEFSETQDRRPMSTEEIKRKFADAEEVGESSDDDDIDDDPDIPGGSGRRRARRSQRARRATTFFKPGRRDKVHKLQEVNRCRCKRCRIAAVQGGTPQPRVVKYSFNKVYNDPKLWDLWREPCDKEWAQFHEAGRTQWGIPAKGDKVIGSFWRLLEYFNDAGHLLKRKSRICIQGNQISAEDNDFDYSFSSTVSYDQVRLLAALCAVSNKSLFTADVRGAFLSVPREQKPGFTKLWMRPPSKQYQHPDDSRLCLEVKAAFYGLRDSARLWWLKFRQALVSVGFRKVDEDPCFYVRDTLSEQRKAPPDIKSKTFAAAAMWVDDLLCLSSEEEFKKVVNQLKENGVDIDKQSPVQKYVGLDFHITYLRHNKQDEKPVLIADNINRLYEYKDGEMTTPRVEFQVMELADKQKTVTVTQTAYIVDTFRASGVEPRPCVKTPAPVGWVLNKRDMPKVPDPARVKYFRSIYGRVLHIARCTRPDLAWVTSELGRCMSSPSEEHVNVLKRVVQYLYNTRGLGLRYGGKAFRNDRNARNKVRVQVQQDYEPMAYTDASFADEPVDRRSMSGYVILINGAAIAYRSKRQSFAVSSTCESEIMALSSVVREIQALTRMLTDLGFRDADGPPVVVYEDNSCALSHCYDDTSHGRTKALDLRDAVVRQAVERGIMNVVAVRSKEQLADMMCKQADKGSFEAMRDAVLGMSMSDVDESLRVGEASGASCTKGSCTCSEDLDNARKRAAARKAAREREESQRASAGAGGAAAPAGGSGERAAKRLKVNLVLSGDAAGGRRAREVHWSG